MVALTTETTGDLSQFEGSWYRHGVGIAVSAAGELNATYRIYKWCDEDPVPPCDGMEGHNIIDGGHVTARLEQFTDRSAKIIVIEDTGELAIDNPAIFELLDDGKARYADLILCSETTAVDQECGPEILAKTQEIVGFSVARIVRLV